MNTQLFHEWYKLVKPNQALMRPLVQVLSRADPGMVDRILTQAKADPGDPWSLEEVVSTLKANQVDVRSIESAQSKLSKAEENAPELVVVQEAEPTFVPLQEEDSGQPARNVAHIRRPTSEQARGKARKTVSGFASGLLSSVRSMLTKKTKAPGTKAGQPVNDEEGFFPKMLKNKNLMIGIGVGLLILILAIVAFSMFGNMSGFSSDTFSSPDSYSDFDLPEFSSGSSSDRVSTDSEFMEPGSASGEVAPRLVNPRPLDFVSTPWLKNIQVLIFVQLLGVIASVVGDAKFRKQWVDSFVAVICAVITIFVVVPAGTPIGFAVIPLLAMIGIVLLVSFMGGRDFSPTAAYFLIVGIVGGLIFNKIELLQGVVSIPSAPVLPMVQMGVLFQLRNWDLMWFPILVYGVIIIGVAFSTFEALRPSEDQTSRWGTVIAAGVGLVTYLAILYGLRLDAWICYLVAFSLSIGVSALTQNERAIRVITDQWGVRSAFDGAMLLTSVLLLMQIVTGSVGLF